jgi:hypothetical protein
MIETRVIIGMIREGDPASMTVGEGAFLGLGVTAGTFAAGIGLRGAGTT